MTLDGTFFAIVLIICCVAWLICDVINARRFKRYKAAVKFQLSEIRMKHYNEKRAKRMWKKGVSPQLAAWRLLNENRRAADKR